MVKRKEPVFDLKEILRKANEAKGEKISARYVLYEVTPGYTIPGYYEQEVATKRVRVTDGSRDEIIEFVGKFSPDKGKHFEVRLEELFEKTEVTRKWYDAGVARSFDKALLGVVE